MLPTETGSLQPKEGRRKMKKYTTLAVAFAVLGAVIGAIVLVATNDEPTSGANQVHVCEASAEEACLTGMAGRCADGVRQCLSDRSGFGPCIPSHYRAPAELCGDGLDNNCDGLVDEECEAYFLVQDLMAMLRDYDDDGVRDYWDNCLADPNLEQANSDDDRFGDACDPNGFCSADKCMSACVEQGHFGGLCTNSACECVS